VTQTLPKASPGPEPGDETIGPTEFHDVGPTMGNQPTNGFFFFRTISFVALQCKAYTNVGPTMAPQYIASCHIYMLGH
jgi:hypothetical protein